MDEASDSIDCADDNRHWYQESQQSHRYRAGPVPAIDETVAAWAAASRARQRRRCCAGHAAEAESGAVESPWAAAAGAPFPAPVAPSRGGAGQTAIEQLVGKERKRLESWHTTIAESEDTAADSAGFKILLKLFEFLVATLQGSPTARDDHRGRGGCAPTPTTTTTTTSTAWPAAPAKRNIKNGELMYNVYGDSKGEKPERMLWLHLQNGKWALSVNVSVRRDAMLYEHVNQLIKICALVRRGAPVPGLELDPALASDFRDYARVCCRLEPVQLRRSEQQIQSLAAAFHRRVQRSFYACGHKRSKFRTVTTDGAFKRGLAEMARGGAAALQAQLGEPRGPIEAAQSGGLQSGSIIISIKVQGCHGANRERMILVYYWMLDLDSDDFQSLFTTYTDPDHPNLHMIVDQGATKYEGGVFSFRITDICIDVTAGDGALTEKATVDEHGQYVNDQRFAAALNVAAQECDMQLREVMTNVSLERHTRKRLASMSLDEDAAMQHAPMSLPDGGAGREPSRKQPRSAPAPSHTWGLPKPDEPGMAECLQNAVAQMGAYASIPPKVRAWVQRFSSDIAVDTKQFTDGFQATAERLAAALVDGTRKTVPQLHVALTLPTHEVGALHSLAELVASVLHVCGFVQGTSVQKAQADHEVTHEHPSAATRSCVLLLVTAGQEAAAVQQLTAARRNPNVVVLLAGTRKVVDQLLKSDQEARAMFNDDDAFCGVVHMAGPGDGIARRRVGPCPLPLALCGTKTAAGVAAGNFDDGFAGSPTVAPASPAPSFSHLTGDQRLRPAVRAESGVSSGTPSPHPTTVAQGNTSLFSFSTAAQ